MTEMLVCGVGVGVIYISVWVVHVVQMLCIVQRRARDNCDA